MKRFGIVVVRETKYIAVCVILLSAIMEAMFLLLGYWNYKVLLGNLLSGVFAVANFFFMGVTVENTFLKEEKEAKNTIRASQMLRTFMLFVIVVAGVLLPCFDTAASIIPLFFVRIAIACRPYFKINKIGGVD